MKRTIKLLLLTVLGTWMAGSAWADDYFVNGDGTIGWKSGNEYNLSPAALVNVSDNVWVWAGKMNANKNFRITGINWGGFWATSNGDLLGTEEKSLKNTQDGGDFSFVVAEEGIYKVTVNTSALTIKAEKMAEPTKIGDYYQIATVNDYYWFAGTVTSAESSTAKAQLTADLDFAETGFFPLACDMFKFKGEFDGAGHTISNAKIIGTNNNVAFVRYATGGTNIHDLIIEGSFEGNAKIGGIIGFARDNGGEADQCHQQGHCTFFWQFRCQCWRSRRLCYRWRQNHCPELRQYGCCQRSERPVCRLRRMDSERYYVY